MKYSILLLGLLVACGGAQASVIVSEATTYYTQHNLRSDDGTVVSLNDWDFPTLIPACTPVHVSRVRGNEIRFRIDTQPFRYLVHRTSSQDVAQHFNRVFSTTPCDVNAYDEPDRTGIRTGQPSPGMSRQGVVVALGYPPDHRTPSIETSPWTYWGQEDVVLLHFEGDTLVRVEGDEDEPAVIAAASTAVPTDNTNAPPPPVEGHRPSTVEGQGSMVTFTDRNGYPVQVPQSAIGAPCGPSNGCHQALICISGSCQVPQ